jgi:glutamate carboxypeptidase
MADSDVAQELRRSFQDVQPSSVLASLEDLVRMESPSHDKAALDALSMYLREHLRAIGASIEIIANEHGGDHVLARFPGPPGKRPALVLGHFDTVWPKGTIKRLPFRVDGEGRAFGPGIFDMKAAVAALLWALPTVTTSQSSNRRPIWALLTSDEEIGSPTSRTLIENLVRDCAYVLVLEPPLADGGLKTARKGVGRFRLEIEGRAAHAGAAPDQGRSAIIELAHQVFAIVKLQDLGAGSTINVGTVAGGTTANVVPARASAEIDARAVSAAEAARITAALTSLKPVTPDVHLTVTGGFTRPPMERTPAIAKLFEQAQRIGRKLGVELTEGSTGGGSDGNFTAALGIPTLDGLGVRGAGGHADHEHILIDAIMPSVELLAALLLELEGD